MLTIDHILTIHYMDVLEYKIFFFFFMIIDVLLINALKLIIILGDHLKVERTKCLVDLKYFLFIFEIIP